MRTPIECMEPEVMAAALHFIKTLQGGEDLPDSHILAPTFHSMAISLKRIADALDGTAIGVDITESLAGLAHHIKNRT